MNDIHDSDSKSPMHCQKFDRNDNSCVVRCETREKFCILLSELSVFELMRKSLTVFMPMIPFQQALELIKDFKTIKINFIEVEIFTNAMRI